VYNSKHRFHLKLKISTSNLGVLRDTEFRVFQANLNGSDFHSSVTWMGLSLLFTELNKNNILYGKHSDGNLNAP